MAVSKSLMGQFQTHAAQQMDAYSIISSARPSSDCGTAMPSALHHRRSS
jgi:hypothetical protein